jgi:chlorobactene glucosyltransferase
MTRLAAASHLTALVVLSALTHRLWRNLRFLNQPSPLSAVSPRVSILVPARNEARTITACIESLSCQDYPDLEVIALDDQSSDETGVLLDDLAARHGNLTVIHGTENPPEGWNGKSYACHRLAERARGEWLLFTDADTLHAPTSIAQGIAHAEHLRADLLSAFPRQITESWSEQIVVSFILDFLPLVGVDLTTLGESGNAIAIGQYLLVRGETYRAIGGHTAIFDALVDDFALAKRVSTSGYKVALVDGTNMLSCRMYQNAREVWEGFSKNILLALETSSAEKRPAWWNLIFAWGYACVFVLPFYRLLEGSKLALLEIGWLGILRAAVSRHLNRPPAEVVTTPLAAWSVMAFGLIALLRRRLGGSIRWKDRDYPLTN